MHLNITSHFFRVITEFLLKESTKMKKQLLTLALVLTTLLISATNTTAPVDSTNPPIYGLQCIIDDSD